MKGALGVLALPLAFVLPLAVLSGGGDSAAPKPGGGGDVSGVPTEYQAVLKRAGSICPEVTAPALAAQIEAESNWDPAATSPAGAQGIAQFMPGTWASAGKDGDGDGRADISNPQDAIYSQGAYMCSLVEGVKKLQASGSVSGEVLDLALAAYNAGLGAVQSAGGIPQNGETPAYVERIKAAMANYVQAPGGAGGPGVAGASAGGLEDSSPVPGTFAPEAMSLPDPTPGAHGTALITPRMSTLITDVMSNYPQIVQPALYCWDAHPYNSASDHPQGRACDIPFYSCAADPQRSADPSTGTAAGNAAANWMAANAGYYGIHYIIWRGQEWDASTGVWVPYDGAGGLYDTTDCSGGHYDHIHVSVF
ncbi:lytic transglycosylase domain-containing protein [Actinomyces marmotae]|uniref:Lytic transglycosylase domain-containing protein n=1 Tax=Actinomyces marmotae TaxID=2737173 RepID=A0A6M8AZS8_9ACTO|nr:lytic transglycosylase domain-containing protein [Actinomyces marmotae]